MFGLNDRNVQEESIESHFEEEAKLNYIVRDATLLELPRSHHKEINIGNGVHEENVFKVNPFKYTKILSKKDNNI